MCIPPGLLHGRVLRSPHAHARIISIDTSKAEAVPGVRAVATSTDLPQFAGSMADLGEGAMVNFKFLSNNCLAHDKVLYAGQAVAAVAATSPEAAEEGMNAIEVQYEVLSPVMDGRDAMKSGAPILHDQLATLTNPTIRAGAFRGDEDDGGLTNVASHIEFTLGDPDEAFKQADAVVEHETHTAAVHQGYIEPHAATAQWHPDGHITVWSSSQGHFAVRDQTATILGLPVSQVTAIPMEIGGGFGGKTLVYLEPVCAVLSRKSGGAPVKLTMNRTEVFEGTGPTSGTHIKVKLGGTKDGKITAVSSTLVYEAGAFPGSPMSAGIRCMLAPYDIPNGYLEGYDVVVNKPKSAAYRAPGSPAAAFAMETTVDLLCEKLNMDPLEFRLINASKEGTRQVTRPGVRSHRQCGDHRGSLGPPPLQDPTGRPQPRPGRRLRFLVQRQRALCRRRHRQRRRHRGPHRGLARHRRHSHHRIHAAGRGARDPRRGRTPSGRGHRLHRFHLRDRWQQHHLQDRVVLLRGGPGCEAPVDYTRCPHLGSGRV